MSFFKLMQVSKPNCTKCGLHKNCLSPKMEYSGMGNEGVLIISAAPTQEEDMEARHFAGTSGDIVRKSILRNHMVFDRDCWAVNSVNCRPFKSDGSGKLDDTEKYINHCRPYLESVLKDLKPKKIILLGKDAVNSFYRGSMPWDRCMNTKLWDSEYNAWVFPTYHPIDLLKFSKDRGMRILFERAMTDALTHTTEPLQYPFVPTRKLIVYEDVLQFLDHVFLNEKLIAIDYETTGLNFKLKGHKTACISIANHKESVAFLAEHPYYTAEQQSSIMAAFKKILRNRKIKKIVHNLQYEVPWSRYVIKQAMNNVHWDTMLGAHLLDNRQGITSLKFQARVRWGIPDYSADIKPFLETDPRTGYNNVFKVPIDKLLQYNALDGVYTVALYDCQQAELTTREKEEAYPLFHKASIIFSEMSYNGILIDQAFYEAERLRLVSERDELIQRVQNSSEVARYNRKYGTGFNMDSPPNVQDLLFTVMGIVSKKKTAGGSDSVDADVLSKIDHSIVRDILKVRKLNKVIGTYIDGFSRMATDSFLHPQFLLNIARSFRSSSKQPNFQNSPKRDKQATKAVRSGIVPKPGCVLVEGDFSGAEIVTSCTFHRDPTFINYQMKEDADMHKDAAGQVFKAMGLISKGVRQGIKSGFVFSQFYGSYWATCALKMFEEMLELELSNGVKLGDHISKVDLLDFEFGDGTNLKDKLTKELSAKNISIKDLTLYERFEQRVKAFEHMFWYEWFPVYTKWKKDIYEGYLKDGYIETFFGFRFRGYMDRKQASNYPVQGTSFHILLFALIKLDREIKARGMKTQFVGQIHDSIVAQVPVEELELYCTIFTGVVDNLINDLPWLCIPMRAEIEVSKTREEGGSFAEMTKIVG